MVRDGYLYGISLLVVAALARYFTSEWIFSWALTLIPVLLAAFFLNFFRDPERTVPEGSGLIVSPVDGKVTQVAQVQTPTGQRTRISIFLNVFSVHVNRSPVSGVVRDVIYKKGEYLNALNPASAERNEQCSVTVAGEGAEVTFKLIAGLLARRIVFKPKVGDHLARGQRVGMIKFGSRCDILLPPGAHVRIEVGQYVKGGSGILADVEVLAPQAAPGSPVPAETRA